MILIEHIKLELKNPSDFKELSVDKKNFIYDRLKSGRLLFIVPDKIKNLTDKNILNAYKVGFLNDLMVEVYGDSLTNFKRHEYISINYQMYITYRTFYSHYKLYQEKLK